jgi:hypothetical protein
MARAVVALCAALLAPAQRLDLGSAQEIAPGVELYHVTDTSLLAPEAPISIWILRLERVQLRAALANDEIMGTETVADMASRHAAVAAINAGFFAPNGDPAVSDARRARGAIGILTGGDGQHLIVARLRASMALRIVSSAGQITSIPIDGVDTTRVRGRLMLFTPAYHSDTDTAPGGREWTLAGSPLRVIGSSRKDGKTPIPPRGFVLSFGGESIPATLKRLKNGTHVSLETHYEPLEGAADEWSRAQYIVGGAGLLLRNGEPIEDWSVEQFTQGFAENRHPRTMIGTGSDGSVWLVVVDGRQPQLSAGMTLVELRALAQRLDLTNALNLDGGGSTTMWVQGKVVNSPSDATGPRKVSDALLVFLTPDGGP